MRATPSERGEFSQLLDQYLEVCDLTAADLRRRLADEHGIKRSGTAVSNWLAGRFAPDRKTTAAIDQIVGGNGTLLRVLGYSSVGEGLELPPEVKAWSEGLAPKDRQRLDELIDYVARRTAQLALVQIHDALGAALGDARAVEVVQEGFALAAHDGSGDDEVGPPSKRPPVGATPEEPATP